MGALLRVLGMMIGVYGLLTVVNGLVDTGLGDEANPFEVVFGLVFLAVGIYSFVSGNAEDARR